MIFVSSEAAALRHGVYAQERTPPATIQATGTGVVGIVGQFPWGPMQQVVEPTGTKELLNMYGPRGMTLTGKGYLSLIGKGFPSLRIVRALGTTAAKATATLIETGPTSIATVTAKYEGAEGNNIDCVVSNASDGDADHFNLTVTVTGASGTTTDYFFNLNYSGTGADSTPTYTDKLLVSAITKLASGRPDNGTYSMSAGSDGTVAASDYVGTAGSPDKGLSLFEDYSEIRHVCVDDPGNTLRAAVNAGIKAHVDLMTDRIGYINGNSGVTTIASVGTDAATYASDRVVYVDPWPYIYDDVDAAEQLVPPAPFAASVCAQMSPSTSPAWKATEVKKLLGAIVRLETPRGNASSTNTTAGVMTIVKEKSGYAFEAGVLTVAPSNPSLKRISRRRIGDYIAISFVDSVRELVDAPNVEVNQVSLVAALTKFMDTLVRNKGNDPNHTPHVIAYQILDLAGVNSADDIASGKFTIPLNVRTSAGMEKIFLSIQFGENVVINAS